MNNEVNMTSEKAGYLDFHSHILPGMDDGSIDMEMTAEMLRASVQNRISAIVATSHFYPTDEDPESFLARRSAALSQVGAFYRAANEPLPDLYVGAEVAYYHGIGMSQQMKRLCLLGTNVILVEMPFEKWTDSVVDDLLLLKSRLGLQPVIAHIERYIQWQSQKTVDALVGAGVFVQINAEAFADRHSQRVVMKQFKRGNIHLLGSDTHNCSSRPQNFGVAIQFLEKNSCTDFLQFNRNLSGQILKHAVKNPFEV